MCFLRYSQISKSALVIRAKITDDAWIAAMAISVNVHLLIPENTAKLKSTKVRAPGCVATMEVPANRTRVQTLDTAATAVLDIPDLSAKIQTVQKCIYIYIKTYFQIINILIINN